MVSRVTPTTTPRPAAVPAPPSPDIGVIAELTAQNSKLIAMLDTQNNRMLALLERMVQNATPGAASPDAAAPATPAAPANVTAPATPVAPASPVAPANVTAQASPTVHTFIPPSTASVNIFGQERLTHVTGERIQAILDEALRTSEAKASFVWGAPEDAAAWDKMDVDCKARLVIQSAGHTVLLDMAKLIHSIPENQTWYTLKRGSVMICSNHGWVPRPHGHVVKHIMQIIVQQMFIKLSTDVRVTKYVDVITYIKADLLGSASSAVAWYVSKNTVQHRADTATPPLAAADTTDFAAPPQTVEVCAPELNEFGEETLTHITGEQVKAILDDGLRAASVSEPAGLRIHKAAEIVALEVAKLIYSIPENRTWYVVSDDHRSVSGNNRTVMNYSDGSWVASWYRDVIEIIDQTVLDVLNIKLPREDKSMYACFITSMAKLRLFTPDHLYIVNPGAL